MSAFLDEVQRRWTARVNCLLDICHFSLIHFRQLSPTQACHHFDVFFLFLQLPCSIECLTSGFVVKCVMLLHEDSFLAGCSDIKPW